MRLYKNRRKAVSGLIDIMKLCRLLVWLYRNVSIVLATYLPYFLVPPLSINIRHPSKSSVKMTLGRIVIVIICIIIIVVNDARDTKDIEETLSCLSSDNHKLSKLRYGCESQRRDWTTQMMMMMLLMVEWELNWIIYPLIALNINYSR